jgi:hypothetical protein
MTRSKLTSPKFILLLGVVGIALVAAIVWFGLVSPEQSRSAKLETEIGDVTTQLQQARVAARADHGEAKTAKEKLRLLAVAMPTELQMSEVMRELIWNARRADVQLDAVKPAAGTIQNGYVAVPMDVTVTGRYFNVERLLRQLRLQAGRTADGLHAAGRLFDVVTVGFQTTSPDSRRITATLHMNAFVYSPSSAAAPVSGQEADEPILESASAAGRMP